LVEHLTGDLEGPSLIPSLVCCIFSLPVFDLLYVYYCDLFLKIVKIHKGKNYSAFLPAKLGGGSALHEITGACLPDC
jgi:hypothetical protein